MVNAYVNFGYIFGIYNYAGAVEVTQYYGGNTSGTKYYIPAALNTVEVYKTTVLPAYAFNHIYKFYPKSSTKNIFVRSE